MGIMPIVMLTQKTLEYLTSIGWFSGRAIDTSEYTSLLLKYQIVPHQYALTFYSEFGNLKGHQIRDKNMWFKFKLDDDEYMGEFIKFIVEINEEFNLKLIPVGVGYYDVLIDSKGDLYYYFEGDLSQAGIGMYDSIEKFLNAKYIKSVNW